MTTTTQQLPVPFELASRQFDLVVRRLADDLTYGSDASRFVGPGTDYAQTRLYSLGDSVRSIDWKVTARTGKFHVKDYEAPKRITLYIIVDTSSSMSISSTALTKQAAAVWIAGALALVAHRRRNPVALLSGGSRDVSCAPSLSRSKVYRMIDSLREDPAGIETTNIATRIEQVESLTDRTCLVIVLGELLDPAAIPAIKRIRQKHDALVLQLVDPAEFGGLRAGFIRAAEAESGNTFFAGGRSRFFGDPVTRCARELADGGVDHVVLRTDQPFVPSIRRALMARGGGKIAR